MELKEQILIDSNEIPTRIVETGEKRQYYLFHERDPNYPLERIITEIPPGYSPPWHAHQTINEITVVLFGEIVGMTKKEKNTFPQEQHIKAIPFFDPERHNFHAITAAKDGTILLVLEDKETGEIIGGELPYDEGFNAGKAFHTAENRTDQWVTTATVKITTPEIFAQNPRIFLEDKIS